MKLSSLGIFPGVTKKYRLIAAITSWLLLLCVTTQAQEPASAPGEFIIKFKTSALKASLRDGSVKKLGKRFRRNPLRSIHDVKRALIKKFEFEQRHEFSFIGATVVKQKKRKAKETEKQVLAHWDLIEYIEPNYEMKLLSGAGDPMYSQLWGMNSTNNVDIDAPQGWTNFSGQQDVVVGVIDGGIDYNHPDIAANMWRNTLEVAGNNFDDDANGIVDDVFGYNPIDQYVPNGNIIRAWGDPMDDVGHGTHVAGTIAGVGNNGIGVIGVAGANSRVKLMAIRMFNDREIGYLIAGIAGIDYAIRLKQRGVNLRVFNASWGSFSATPYPEPTSLRDAIQRAESAGIIFITSAGNSNANNDTSSSYPANCSVPSIISVAALGTNGALGTTTSGPFSNYGVNNVDIGAPGVGIWSTIPAAVNAAMYLSYNGTSMAAPHVAGIAAMVASQSPGLSPLQIRSVILGSGKPIASLTGKIANPAIASLAGALAAAPAGTVPTISTHPSNQSVSVGQSATFTVAATGTGTLSYQWMRNGANISGATNSSYTLSAAPSSYNGSTYRCAVSNNAGSTLSNSGTLTVTTAAPVSITTQPQSIVTLAGATVTFSVAASGGAPITYQWMKNNADIAGATSSSYSLLAMQSDNGSNFSVRASNSVNSVTSSQATLTVNLPRPNPRPPFGLSITSQPVARTVTAGGTATFSVTAMSALPIAYQWQKNGLNIAGATGTSYTTPVTTASMNGSIYRVVVSSGSSIVISQNALLTVNAPASAITITSQPSPVTVSAGQGASFTVAATTTAGTLTYRWLRNGTEITGGAGSGSAYIINPTVAADNGAVFSCRISNGTTTVTSNGATLTVNSSSSAPTIASQPTGGYVVFGNQYSLSVTAGGTGPFTYQWQKNGANIAGETKLYLQLNTPEAVGTASRYRVIVSNSFGNTPSNEVTLTTVSPITITTQPVSLIKSPGQTATFTIAATASMPLSYQWLKNNSAISGATSASYTTPATTLADNGAQYYCRVTTGAGQVLNSNIVTLTVR